MSFSDGFNPTVQKNVFQIFTRDNTTKEYEYLTKQFKVEGNGAALNLQGEAFLEYATTKINSAGETEFSPPIPVTDGLIARYNASSWNSGTSTLEDLVGSYDATSLRGSGPAVKTSTAPGGYSVLYGSSSDGIRFPTGILPQPFQLFHITRYSSTTQGRIITASNTNWLDGHHSGNTAIAYHNGWLGPSSGDPHDQDFFISSSQDQSYRAEGAQIGTGGNTSQAALSINWGGYSEFSDWEVIEIIIYDRELTASEIEEVEGWLAGLYPDATTIEGSSSAYNVGTGTIGNYNYTYDSAEQRIGGITSLYNTDIFRSDVSTKATYVDADTSSGGGGGEVVEEASKERWVAWT